MSNLDIEKNRRDKKYKKRTLLARIIWGLFKIFFKLTPRPCFELRSHILRLFGAKIGKNVHIYPSANIYFPWNLTVGDDSAIGEWVLIYNIGLIGIGQKTTISHKSHLCSGTHDYTLPDLPLVKAPITIGNEVWVCAECFIGPNLKIKDRAIIGAGSVVIKDIDYNNIVAGNPSKFLKYRSLIS